MHVRYRPSTPLGAAFVSGCLVALVPLDAGAAEPGTPTAPATAASAPDAPLEPKQEPAPEQTSEPNPEPLPKRIESTLQTWQEFLDGLVVNALGANPERRYRVDGQRRMVDLGRRWTLALDERPASRLTSAGVGIPSAGQPARSWEILHAGNINRLRFYNQRDGTGRENGASAWTTLTPDWSLHTQGLRLHDDDSGVVRTDAQMGLRTGSPDLWLEGFVRSAGLKDEEARETWANREPRATFGGLQAGWDLTQNISLNAQHQQAITPNMLPGDERLSQPRTEFGVDYTPSWATSGTRMYWHQATQLGLLSSDGLEERTTYRRVFGVETPEGSPDGLVYAQIRQQSLLDDQDALLVAGWRHTIDVAPKWRVQTLIESGIPIGGEHAVRSNTVDVRVINNAFPDHSFFAEVQTVRTPVKNTAFASADYTRRVGDSSVVVVRGSVTGTQPHDKPTDVPENSSEFSTGWGWQEPEERLFSTFWRYLFLGRKALYDGVTTPGVADRRAHLGFGEFDWQGTPNLNLLVRGARRWDRDESFEGAQLRTTNLLLTRLTQRLAERWDLGVHVARLNDSALPPQRGFGATLSVRLNHRVVLALGYNPKGIDDGELADDERLSKGVTLRLFIPTEATLTHWLKPARPAAEAAH